MRTLRRYHSGNDVRMLQYLLGGLDVDGNFGALTEAAVEAFQEAHGLEKDGVCGPKTRAVLGLQDFFAVVCDPKKVRFIGARYEAGYKPLLTLKNWSKQAEAKGAKYLMNLALFNSVGSGSDKYGVIRGRTLTYVKGCGYDIGYGGTSLQICPNSQNACAGYKVGIHEGKRKTVDVVRKRARNANGLLKDGRYIHIQSVGTSTESALVSWAMKNYEIKHLLIQDGGGSVGFYDIDRRILLAPELEGVSGRSVATVAAIFE